MEARFARSEREARVRRARSLQRKLVRFVVAATALATVVAFVASGEFNGLGFAGHSEEAGVQAGPTAMPCPVPERFSSAFSSAAEATGVPLPLLVAVAEQESGFRPEALSTAGAEGLLQVMPATALEVRANPAVPESNVLAGARYLRQMLDRFGGLEQALAAYNAGPESLHAAGGVPTATRPYIENVTRRAEALEGCV